MLKSHRTTIYEQQRENGAFSVKTGSADNQTVTKTGKIPDFPFSPLSPNHAPTKPKREAD